MPDIKPQYESLATHAVTLAREQATIDDMLVDNDVEWSLADMTIENAEWAGNDLFVVHGTCESSQSVQRSSGSRTHPPEYENYDVTVLITVAFYPAKNDGFGTCEVSARQEGGAPSPPDPEPEWRDI